MDAILHKEIAELAEIGHWELNHTTGRLSWSDQIYSLFAVSKEEFSETYEGFLSLVYEEDREKVHKAYTDHLTKGIPYDTQHRIKRPDGTIL